MIRKCKITSGSIFSSDLLLLFYLLFYACRTISYGVQHRGKKLQNAAPFKTEKHAKRRRCSSSCSKNPKCKSYNYCKQYFCELNAEDEFSNDTYFEEDIHCEYGGMTREFMPECKEGEAVKDIESNKTGPCQISQKKADPIWVVTELIDIQNETDYMKYETGFCIRGSHVENLDCLPTDKTWIKFVNENKTYPEAEKHCADIGGQLFGEVEGSAANLQFVASYNSAVKWIGATKLVHIGEHFEWENLRGEFITNKLLWSPAFEGYSSDEFQEYLIVLPNASVEVRDSNFEAFSACQMLFSGVTPWISRSVVADIVLQEGRFCRDGIFGGSKIGCLPTVLFERDLQLEVLSARSLSQAKFFCERSSSKPFDQLDGTQHQLDALVEAFGDPFWLGLKYRYGHWVDRRMKIVDDKILWRDDTPVTGPENSVAFVEGNPPRVSANQDVNADRIVICANWNSFYD